MGHIVFSLSRDSYNNDADEWGESEYGQPSGKNMTPPEGYALSGQTCYHLRDGGRLGEVKS